MNQQDPSSALALSVEGMHCGGCVSSVEKALGSNSSVRAVDVDLSTGRVSVTGMGTLNPDELIATLGMAGFTASVTPRTSGP